MNAVLQQAAAAVRDVWQITFVLPVKEGRPRPREWERGLREVGGAVAVVFGLLGLATVFAVPLRQWSPLTMAPESTQSLPVVALPLLLTGSVLSFALALTAALHTTWWLRLALLVVGGSAIVFFAAEAVANPLLLAPAALGYLGLVGFTIARARRAHAWWEFVVVLGLLTTAMLLPWAIPAGGVGLGIDMRPIAVQGSLLSLQVLVVPALIVAGSAPAQIVVTGAQATADRPVGRGLFWGGFAVAVVWLGVATWQGMGTPDYSAGAFLAAGVALAAAAAVVAAWVRRARQPAPPEPQVYPGAWGGWLYPLAAGIAVLLLLTLPVVLLRAAFQLAGLPEAAGVVDAVWWAFMDNNPGTLWRGLLGLAVLGLGWRLSARGRLGEAVTLGAFGVLVVLDALGVLARLPILNERSTAALGVLAAALALAAGGAEAVAGRFTRARATGVLTVVLLAVLYPHRGVLSDPAGALLVFTGPVVLVFGLAWRVATEAQFTYEGSAKYPRPTRVLLFLANALLAMTTVAFVGLARAAGTDLDAAIWGELGDSVLGDPLYLAGLVAGLWLVLRPAQPAADALAEPPASHSVR